MENTETAVEFRNVTKAYGEVRAVRNLSFSIERGKLVTLLGPSGCGKTTTLRLIAGLEMVTEGNIFIGGKEVTRLSASDRDVSMVFQSYALFPHMTVMQNVSYGLTMSRLTKAQVSEKALEGLELVGLAGFGGRLPSELSGGQQQRVAVARALVLEPEVLLFDEPLSNLDAKLRRRVREEIRELQQKLELTTIYVTHDQEEALAVSDRIIVMNEAVIAQEGTPRQLYEEPDSLFVADFIGDANLAKAELVQLDGKEAEVNIGGFTMRLPHRGLASGAVNVAIRPQAIYLESSNDQAGIPGTIQKGVYLGNHVEYTIDSPVGELFMIDHQVDQLQPSGSKVTISFLRRGVSLVRAD
jgi:iron(III) transport system ATP-binding protein